MQINFIGGAYTARSTNLNAQQCINLYPVIDQEGGKNVKALYPTPGLKLWKDFQTVAEVRGLNVMGDYLIAVVGDTVYALDKNGNANSASTTLNTSSGVVFMENNGTQCMIVDGSYGYIVTLSGGTPTVTQITDEDFPTPSSLTYQDGYFIVSKEDSDRFYISAINDGTSWNSLDYASAEGRSDNLVSCLSDHRELWLFGEETTEVWYNSGNADFPFQRFEGAFLEIGCGAKHSPAKLDNMVFWLTDKGAIVRAVGYNPQIISTRQIEYQISQYSTISDAIGFGYKQEGHAFYVLTFPTANRTWVYDAATGFWHERRSKWPDMTRWRANCYVFFNNKHLVGDMENGKIYELDTSYYKEDDQTMGCIRTCQVIHADRKRIFFHSFEIDFEAGIGLATGQGDDPQAMLQWSDDGGHTWSNEHWRSIGKIGEYKKRVIWRRLGQARERIFKVTITDPVNRVIIGAHLNATIGRS